MVSGSVRIDSVTEDTMHQEFMRQSAAHHTELLRSEAGRARRVQRARHLLRRNPTPRPAC